MTKPALYALLVQLALSVGAVAQDSDDSDAAVSDVTSKRLEAATASSSIQLETTSITGSRELPKVLVIVPWKTSEAMGPGERPLSSLVEAALTPVDPDVFRRQLSYYTKLTETAAGNGSGDSAN